MSSEWQFVLNETSVHFLVSCRTSQRQRILDALEQLASNPYQKGDFEGKDQTGRPVQIKLVAGCLTTFWADPWAKELRVIKIEKV